MPHAIIERLLPPVRSAAATLGGALVRWSDTRRAGDTGRQTGDGGQTPDAEDDVAEPQEHEEQKEPRRSPAELVTTAVSLLLIGLLAGAILYDGYGRGASVPAIVEITVDVNESRQEGALFYVPYEVHNAGDQTIEQALLTFGVYEGEDLIEETDTVIPLLAERGHVSGVLVLDQDPSGLNIEPRVSTFQTSEE